jgi:hypothetical protein
VPELIRGPYCSCFVNATRGAAVGIGSPHCRGGGAQDLAVCLAAWLGASAYVQGQHQALEHWMDLHGLCETCGSAGQCTNAVGAGRKERMLALALRGSFCRQNRPTPIVRRGQLGFPGSGAVPSQPPSTAFKYTVLRSHARACL